MEAVGRLAGGMAHDINNYLAAITAQCELVLMTSDDEDPVRHRMDQVLTTSSKAAALIERLLSFSRQKPVMPEVLNVNRSVEDLMRLVERLVGEDVRLETRLTDELWNVEVDPTQIEQVILNLVVNAREAMPTGGRVLIETSNRTFRPSDLESLPIDQPGDYVVLSMTDTGVGVPEDMRELIFEPFVTTKDTGSQSGLGLAMVYAIANQNGGGVAAYSGEGQGATFKFYLPRSRTLTVSTDKVAAGKIAVPRGTQHILIVEDNAELREAVSEALRGLGYTVSIASNAERALEVFDTFDSMPDLLVSDVVMPGMNGRELWEALAVRHPSLEVIFISGYTDDVILRHGIEEGEYRFLQKPFSIDELAITIASVFE